MPDWKQNEGTHDESLNDSVRSLDLGDVFGVEEVEESKEVTPNRPDGKGTDDSKTSDEKEHEKGQRTPRRRRKGRIDGTRKSVRPVAKSNQATADSFHSSNKSSNENNVFNEGSDIRINDSEALDEKEEEKLARVRRREKMRDRMRRERGSSGTLQSSRRQRSKGNQSSEPGGYSSRSFGSITPDNSSGYFELSVESGSFDDNGNTSTEVNDLGEGGQNSTSSLRSSKSSLVYGTEDEQKDILRDAGLSQAGLEYDSTSSEDERQSAADIPLQNAFRQSTGAISNGSDSTNSGTVLQFDPTQLDNVFAVKQVHNPDSDYEIANGNGKNQVVNIAELVDPLSNSMLSSSKPMFDFLEGQAEGRRASLRGSIKNKASKDETIFSNDAEGGSTKASKRKLAKKKSKRRIVGDTDNYSKFLALEVQQEGKLVRKEKDADQVKKKKKKKSVQPKVDPTASDAVSTDAAPVHKKAKARKGKKRPKNGKKGKETNTPSSQAPGEREATDDNESVLKPPSLDGSEHDFDPFSLDEAEAEAEAELDSSFVAGSHSKSRLDLFSPRDDVDQVRSFSESEIKSHRKSARRYKKGSKTKEISISPLRVDAETDVDEQRRFSAIDRKRTSMGLRTSITQYFSGSRLKRNDVLGGNPDESDHDSSSVGSASRFFAKRRQNHGNHQLLDSDSGESCSSLDLP